MSVVVMKNLENKKWFRHNALRFTIKASNMKNLLFKNFVVLVFFSHIFFGIFFNLVESQMRFVFTSYQ